MLDSQKLDIANLKKKEVISDNQIFLLKHQKYDFVIFPFS